MDEIGRDTTDTEEEVSNWATAAAGFGLDTEFEVADVPNGVKIHPEDGSKTSDTPSVSS